LPLKPEGFRVGTRLMGRTYVSSLAHSAHAAGAMTGPNQIYAVALVSGGDGRVRVLARPYTRRP
jgi:hypothetical protein